MDFIELEAIEGLRWSWNTWPTTPSEASSLVIPLSIMCTPLMQLQDTPLLPYHPLACKQCRAILNPYARVEYQTRVWYCPFCFSRNPFPSSYVGISETNLPAELFPTYSTVEYVLSSGKPTQPTSSSSSISASSSSSSLGLGSDSSVRFGGPGFVFVVDTCMEEEEFGVLKKEILRLLTRLPENAMVGLITFGSMVFVHDLGYGACLRAVVLRGDRDVSPQKIQELLGISHLHHRHFGKAHIHRQGYLLPISDCEFNFTAALEGISVSVPPMPGHRPQRSTGAAIAVATTLLEACLPNTGVQIMTFLSGPTTVGPAMVVETDLTKSIRTHQDLLSDRAPHYKKACNFYSHLAQRLSDSSLSLDVFACSLDQVGTAELKPSIESSGGLMVLAESFGSDQFKKCLHRLFELDHHDMNFNATIDVVTTKEVKICGALGPCVSLRRKNSLVSEKEIGKGGTCAWKLSTIHSKTCIAFFFEVGGEPKAQPGSAFLIQFQTRYRNGNGETRLRVTTCARRWVDKARFQEIAEGFDQEAAASVMARLAIHKAEQSCADNALRWLDKTLIRFAAKFGDYVKEDPSTFRLSSTFSLYPQFMFYLRRSQFLDVFNNTPDETAFFRLVLNREGVVGSLVMIQPTLFRYSFDGPPVPVLLDVKSISLDCILLFDSFFHVVVHFGSNFAQWRKLGYLEYPNYENLRKLMEAPVQDAEALIAERIPVPKLVVCDQHGSQARFLLAKLNPSITQKTEWVDTSSTEMIFTDDPSLQDFMKHLQELAVQS
ncbi:hypothetical protein AMTRI_Chr03g54420 [Amborella trichopoda]